MRLIKRNALITNVEIIETNLALAPGFHRAGNTQSVQTIVPVSTTSYDLQTTQEGKQ